MKKMEKIMPNKEFNNIWSKEKAKQGIIKTPDTHYTLESMAIDLIKLVPFDKRDVVLDAGSGRNKVWYKNIPKKCKALECEIEDGIDFIDDWNKAVDWVIGNPAYANGSDFVYKASQIANKGFAFLGSHNFINSFFLPSRMQALKEKGFFISHIQIVQDKRWYGRYYFIIAQKNTSITKLTLNWTLKTYKP
jgi:hypothetical protein